jgi:hypothetical protein
MRLQFLLACVQRHPAKVFAVQLQDVEGVEIRLVPAVHQRFELTLSTLVETNDLAVDDALYIHACGDLLGQFRESLVDVPLAQNEVALARFHVSESTKPILLDLKQPIRMTERLCSPGKSHGLVGEFHTKQRQNSRCFDMQSSQPKFWCCLNSVLLGSRGFLGAGMGKWKESFCTGRT